MWSPTWGAEGHGSGAGSLQESFKSWALKREWSVVGWGTPGPGSEKRSCSRQNEERTVTWWYDSLKCIPGTPGGPSVAYIFNSELHC